MPRQFGTTQIQALTSAPAVGLAGSTYYDSGTKISYISDGTSWVQTNPVADATVNTNALVLGLSDNLIVDPFFQNAALTAVRLGGTGNYSVSSGRIVSTVSTRMWLMSEKPIVPNDTGVLSGWIPVFPGQNFYMTFMANQVATGTVTWRVMTKDATGVTAAAANVGAGLSTPPGTDIECARSYTVPASGVVAVTFGPCINAVGTSCQIWNIRCRAQTSTNWIEDNAVTIAKIANISIGVTAPAAPAVNDMWVDTS